MILFDVFFKYAILYRNEEKKFMKLIKKAFTLAEILLVLGIIGLVVAMTIPSLVNNFQDQQTVVQLKKAFNTLNIGFASAIANEGEIQDWCPFDAGYTTDQAANQCTMDIISKYIKIAKDCGGTGSGCIPDAGYKYLDGVTMWTGYNNSAYYKFLLSDGSAVILNAAPGLASGGGIRRIDLFVDINGVKIPNRWGYDLFTLEISASDFDTPQAHPRVVSPYSYTRTGNLANVDCKLNSGLGLDCASWVIYNGNLDYKYVNDLNWETKFHK